jgi:hypothetical protein
MTPSTLKSCGYATYERTSFSTSVVRLVFVVALARSPRRGRQRVARFASDEVSCAPRVAQDEQRCAPPATEDRFTLGYIPLARSKLAPARILKL